MKGPRSSKPGDDLQTVQNPSQEWDEEQRMKVVAHNWESSATLMLIFLLPLKPSREIFKAGVD